MLMPLELDPDDENEHGHGRERGREPVTTKETTAEARVSRQRRTNRSSSSKKFTATWQNELVRSPHHERVLERVIEAA